MLLAPSQGGAGEPIVSRGRTLTWLLVVLILSTLGAVAELWGGHVAGSKAILVDGWHMTTHVAAILVSCIVVLGRSPGPRAQRVVTIVNALLLAGAGLFTIGEALESLLVPTTIHLTHGLSAGLVGLAINGLCAAIFQAKFDLARPALRSAYLHVLADIVTSVLALAAVLASPWSALRFLDPTLGLLGGALICLWAVTLARQVEYGRTRRRRSQESQKREVRFDEIETDE